MEQAEKQKQALQAGGLKEKVKVGILLPKGGGGGDIAFIYSKNYWTQKRGTNMFGTNLLELP